MHLNSILNKHFKPIDIVTKDKEDEKMLKTNAMRFVSPFVVLALCTALIPGASAADSDSKSTPYGTMNAYLSIGYDDQHGVDVTAFLQTDIDSSVTMKKITHKIEAQYQDTGATIRSNTYTFNNTNDTGLTFWDVSLDQSKLDSGITVYSTHQVLYTNAYVIYLVDTLPSYWDT